MSTAVVRRRPACPLAYPPCLPYMHACWMVPAILHTCWMVPAILHACCLPAYLLANCCTLSCRVHHDGVRRVDTAGNATHSPLCLAHTLLVSQKRFVPQKGFPQAASRRAASHRAASRATASAVNVQRVERSAPSRRGVCRALRLPSRELSCS